MIKTLRVKPVDGGWMVDSGEELAPLWFRGGGQAESSARRLARVLANDTTQAQVIVHDRHGVVVGSLVVGPEAKAG